MYVRIIYAQIFHQTIWSTQLYVYSSVMIFSPKGGGGAPISGALVSIQTSCAKIWPTWLKAILNLIWWVSFLVYYFTINSLYFFRRITYVLFVIVFYTKLWTYVRMISWLLHGDHVLKKRKATIIQKAYITVLMIRAIWFFRRRFLNIHHIFTLPNNIPLKGDLVLSSNKFQSTIKRCSTFC